MQRAGTEGTAAASGTVASSVVISVPDEVNEWPAVILQNQMTAKY
jgi:hypothetical protein